MWRNDEAIDTTIHSLDGVTWSFGPQAPPPKAANDHRPTARPDGRTAQTTALIHRPGRSVTTSGRAGSDAWVLRFQPPSAQFVEPLMGWCGGDDPMRHVELRFPNREAAVGYAERHGIPYEMSDPPSVRRSAAPPPEEADTLWTRWMLDCLGAFEAGSPWWDNAGPDEHLPATLERCDGKARNADAANANTRPPAGEAGVA